MAKRFIQRKCSSPRAARRTGALTAPQHHQTNREAVAEALSAPVMTKLKLGAPNDTHEREADAMAERVMRAEFAAATPAMGESLQRKCAACAQEDQEKLQRAPAAKEEEEKKKDEETVQRQCTECAKEDEGKVQRTAAPENEDEKLEDETAQRKSADGGENSAVAADAASRIQARRGGGHPLPSNERAFFEPRFGRAFDRVRVHADAESAGLAQSLSARAFTVGRDMFFGAGEYRPGAESSRRLMAHELAHVIQQGATVPEQLRRKPTPKPAKTKPKSKPTNTDKETAPPKKNKPKAAAKNPVLILTKKDSPCACIIVMHNNERNARLTAQLMGQHCTYNLLLLEPDTGARRIKITGRSGDVDPNELFPPDVAEECFEDETKCRAKAKTQVEHQFFIAVSDCTQGFALPLVALHNNAVSDTQKFRDTLAGPTPPDTKDLKGDVDKTKPAGAEQLKNLIDNLEKKFGNEGKNQLVKKGSTNIFRWCQSNDLSRCHIGDPDHPDHVIWVTNAADFAKLSKQDVNVALQSERAAKGGESETDLSTLFLTLKTLIHGDLSKSLDMILGKITLQVDAIKDISERLEELKKFNDLTDEDRQKAIDDFIKALEEIFSLLLLMLKTGLKSGGRLDKLRFVNIETPGEALKSQTDAERADNFRFIADALGALGLNCCDKEGDAKVVEGLKKDKA